MLMVNVGDNCDVPVCSATEVSVAVTEECRLLNSAGDKLESSSENCECPRTSYPCTGEAVYPEGEPLVCGGDAMLTASNRLSGAFPNATSSPVESGSPDSSISFSPVNARSVSLSRVSSTSMVKSIVCENCGQDLVKNTSKVVISIDNPNSSSGSLLTKVKHHHSADFCRICHCDNDKDDCLIAPCNCKGSMTHVHHSCLQKWIKSSGYKHCELCGFNFIMNSKLKPLMKWQSLAMTKTERRKVCCSVFFHVIAITCVVWSLYVLIEKTAFELQTGSLHWPFWTKLAVVAVGLSGGIAFMYVQCKTYCNLWTRWKAFNRVIIVENRPEYTECHSRVDGSSPGVATTSLKNAIEMSTMSSGNRSDQTIVVS